MSDPLINPRDRREQPRDPRDERRLTDPADPRDKRVIPTDARDERLASDPRDVRYPYDENSKGADVRIPASIISAAYMIFGLALWLQPGRWSRTPAYGILLDLFPQQVWGSIYIVVALVLALSVWVTNAHSVGIAAHAVAIALTTVWLTAFVVRWVTDSATTVVNPVNWSVLLAVLIYSMSLVSKRSTYTVPVGTPL